LLQLFLYKKKVFNIFSLF